MADRPVMKVVILGGGTAGWMSAAALSRFLGDQIDITLVESEAIGIVGVGEATLPHLRAFIQKLGLDEAQFMRRTNATFKLGIDFRDFGRIGDSYIHPFGDFGVPLAGVDFHQYWLRARGEGLAEPIDQYCLPILAARANRFALPGGGGDLLSDSYGYAYQFDALKMAPMLREFSEARGVKRVEGRVTEVERDGQSGDVRSLLLESGELVAGDLFVDCSGFARLLVSKTPGAHWEDWKHWLPCDRAAAMPCAAPEGPIEPYTRATAMPAGWRWRIPLQHRVGNGYVYSSAHISDEEACTAIADAVEGEAMAEPRVLRFGAGRWRESWIGNVVSVGLASGFLEPLESTSIHLVQMAVTRLIELFPDKQIDPRDRAEFNRLIDTEYDRIRDFLILHYHATARDDSEFWNHVRTMEVPASLAHKLELWRQSGRVEEYGEGLFLKPSWVAVYLGQNVMPEGYDPRAARMAGDQLSKSLADLQGAMAQRVSAMPDHEESLRQFGGWGQ